MDCEAFRDDMLDVLYGEGGEAAARRFEAHQAACADCRREMAQLRSVRGDLSHWRLPERLRTAPARVSAPRLPLALAAAAGLVLALGAALGLSGAEMRYDASGFSVRLGRGASEARALLAAQDRRHREEIDGLRAELALLRPADHDALQRMVSDMIRESEARHDAAIQASLRDLRQRSDTQRQYDLARVSAGLAYLDGKAGLQAARTTELMGHLLQASQQK
jgi:hypothetical protein